MEIQSLGAPLVDHNAGVKHVAVVVEVGNLGGVVTVGVVVLGFMASRS